MKSFPKSKGRPNNWEHAAAATRRSFSTGGPGTWSVWNLMKIRRAMNESVVWWMYGGSLKTMHIWVCHTSAQSWRNKVIPSRPLTSRISYLCFIFTTLSQEDLHQLLRMQPRHENMPVCRTLWRWWCWIITFRAISIRCTKIRCPNSITTSPVDDALATSNLACGPMQAIIIILAMVAHLAQLGTGIYHYQQVGMQNMYSRIGDLAFRSLI